MINTVGKFVGNVVISTCVYVISGKVFDKIIERNEYKKQMQKDFLEDYELMRKGIGA